MQCAIINHQICQRLDSPSTQNTMSQIIDRYSSQTLTKHECNDSQKKSFKIGKECHENLEIQMVKKYVKV